MPDKPSVFEALLLETLVLLHRVRELGDPELRLVADLIQRYDETTLRRLAEL
jgi:hypothetical protein